MTNFYIAIFVLIGSSFSDANAADSYVRGYTRSNGTYVQGYHRTTPDDTVNNNYGTSGNRNPFTGEDGRVDRNPSQNQGSYNLGNGEGSQPTRNSYSNPYKTYEAPSYGSGSKRNNAGRNGLNSFGNNE